MNKRIKKILTAILSFILIFALAIPTFAGRIGNSQVLVLDGIVYTITESTDSRGNKVVTVSGAGEISEVTFDGTYLHLIVQNEQTGSRSENSVLLEPAEISMEYSSSSGRFSNASPFWNYSWAESQPSPTLLQDVGLSWVLSSGDTYGRHAGYDFNNVTARSYARSFAREVDEIATQQMIAIGIVGAGIAGAIAAAVVTVGAAGIGAVVAAILVLGGAIGSAPYWYAAWSASNRANRDFTRLQPMIYWPQW